MDRFEVVRTLGRGAFASVFYVRQKADGEDLVVKKFHRPMDELSPKERQEVRGWLVVQAWGGVRRRLVQRCFFVVDALHGVSPAPLCFSAGRSEAPTHHRLG